MLEPLVRYAASYAEEKASQQNSLFGDSSVVLPEPQPPHVDKWQPMEKLRHEFDAVGFYLSAHPLDSMTTQLERLKIVPSSQVAQQLASGPSSRLRMAGIVVRKQERTSQKGNRFAFVQVSDQYGVFELTVFSDLLNASREHLEAGTPILLTVDVDRKNEDELRFLAQSIEPLTNAVQGVTRAVEIVVEKPEAVAQIKTVLAAAGQGRIKVRLLVDAGQGGRAALDLPGAYQVSEDVPRALRSIRGVVDVAEI
jgi:DNA polymerase-3 subunit alpha